MKTTAYILPILLSFLIACGQEINNKTSYTKKQDTISENINETNNIHIDILNPNGKTIEERVLVPSGYARIEVDDSSFGKYLRQLPLKPHNTEVKLFNGDIKVNYDVYDAVVDLPIGKRDLHQCADAVMRLRAEYLYEQKLYDKIHFNFTNGFRVDYSKWIKGNRMVIKGNKTYWTLSAKPSNTYQDFWEYMELIFMYAGTLSLSKELISVEIENLKIGDVFIHGGSPGHSVIVVDVAINQKTNEKIFLLAQSYMPAQEIQILKNLNEEKISPWYSISFGDILDTPEWNFDKTDLKRFEE